MIDKIAFFSRHNILKTQNKKTKLMAKFLPNKGCLGKIISRIAGKSRFR